MNAVSDQQILAVLNHPRLELNGIQFSGTRIRRFQEFCTLLHKWNSKINLTSEKNAAAILEKHVFDSLHYLRWIDSSHPTLDIGSGAGFPGIPIKIFYSELEITLMESQRKRCNFLREVIRHLKLDRISVAEGRAEEFSNLEGFAGAFGRVLFRGFGSYQACLETGLPFLYNEGKIILQKSPGELPDSTRQPPANAPVVESREVYGWTGQSSMMMVIEKRST